MVKYEKFYEVPPMRFGDEEGFLEDIKYGCMGLEVPELLEGDHRV